MREPTARVAGGLYLGYSCRVIDVGSEWRTFSVEKSGVDRSRVGKAEVCSWPDGCSQEGYGGHFLAHTMPSILAVVPH